MDWMHSAWFWGSLALALFALEALTPGVFMLWFGVAAVGTGLLRLLIPEMGLLAQWGVFALLSLATVALAWKLRRRQQRSPSDHPHLNRRAEQLVGRVLALDQPIVNGRGRIKVGDGFWIASGPDLPAGTRVRVEAALDGRLEVRSAE